MQKLMSFVSLIVFLQPVDFYAKSFRGNQRPNNYIRTTVGSNHSNQFDLPTSNQGRVRGQVRHFPHTKHTKGLQLLHILQLF